MLKESAPVAKTLTAFLNQPINSTSREALLLHRFMYDMTLAAAVAEYALVSLIPTVDREGVDVVLSDHDTIKPVQLKSRMTKTRPSSLAKNVHASVLKPHRDVADSLQFGTSGQGGAVVLMEISEETPQMLGVRYWYTDAFVLTALKHRLIDGAPPKAEQDARELIDTLYVKRSNGRVDLPVSCFIPLKSPAALLGIGGWFAPTPFHSCHWRHQLAVWLAPPAEQAKYYPASSSLDPEVSAKRFVAHVKRMLTDELQSFAAWPVRGTRTRNNANAVGIRAPTDIGH